MTPLLRKLVLTAHITVSVGWLGAVAGFLALAVAGLISQDPAVIRAAYRAMELLGWFVLVPLSLAPLLLTGPLLSLGTKWGLFRHYWILAKLLINILASLLLLVHMQLVSHLANVAETGFATDALRPQRIQLVAYAAAALLVLLVATALAVYKPRGLTRYGWRKQQEQRTP